MRRGGVWPTASPLPARRPTGRYPDRAQTPTWHAAHKHTQTQRPRPPRRNMADRVKHWPDHDRKQSRLKGRDKGQSL